MWQSFLCSWWRYQVETFSALLALCEGNSPVTGEFPSQRPVTRSFDIFLVLRLNKRLSKQSWGWWFETPSCLLWRHCYVKITKGFWIFCNCPRSMKWYIYRWHIWTGAMFINQLLNLSHLLTVLNCFAGRMTHNKMTIILDSMMSH